MNEDDAKPKEPLATTSDEEDREAILARRARFVATALAGLTGLTACDPRPQPCLNISPLTTSSAPGASSTTPEEAPTSEPEPLDAGAPRPCLDVAPPRKPSGTAPPNVAPPASGSAEPAPSPCLSLPMPSSRPQPCLAPPPNRPPADGKK